MDLFRFNSAPGKPLLHLAHANGFPPRAYRLFLEPFLDRFQALALPARPFWPGSDPAGMRDWSLLTDDLLAALRPLAASAPGGKITGVGHSLGGVLTLQAAVREPGLFDKVVLIDPTMLAPSLLLRARVMKALGLEFRKDLVEGALRRRRHWDSREAALTGWRDKPLFRSWPPEVLRDYVEGMIVEDGDGARLAYPPEWEARVYRTIPTDVWKWAPRLRVPVLVVRGESSNTFTAAGEAAFRKSCPGAALKVVPGAGHLVPLEKPRETAALVLGFLAPPLG